MNHMKAQFWSFDLIFAVIVFTVTITILAYTWYNLSAQLSTGYTGGSTIMSLQSQALSAELLSTGSPVNWQSAVNSTNSVAGAVPWNATGMGLAAAQGSSALSAQKVYALSAMASSNYQATKLPLGVSYDYYIVISSNPASGAGINITIGRNPYANGARTLFVQRRAASLDGIPVTVQSYVWTATQSAVG